MYSTGSLDFATTVFALNKHATICSNPERKPNDNFTVLFNAYDNELKHKEYDLTDIELQASRLFNAYFAFSRSCRNDVE